MDQTEVILFITLSAIILAIFFAGIVLFVFYYRKRRILYSKEKIETEKQHQLDLLNTQLQTQRQTMQHIGQEIHDSVAQKLTLASIYTQRMQFENKAASANIDSVSKIINDALLELRQLSRELTESRVLNERLDELVREECDKVSATGSCRAVLTSPEILPLDIAVKNSLLRIVQEFIQNSLKHATCKTITIFIVQDQHILKMKLLDDGKGFDTTAATHKGIGLDNIRRRVQFLGGTYELKSEINYGTRLELSVPLQTRAI